MKKFFLITASTYLVLMVCSILLTLIFIPDADVTQNVDLILSGPSLKHIFGTDTLGRDLLLRVLVGGRNFFF